MNIENVNYSLSLERQILGAMMLEQTAFGRCYKIISKECFYKPSHQQIYQAIAESWDNNEPIDQISIYLKLCKHGTILIEGQNTAFFISKITYGVTSTASLEYHSLLLKQMYVDREVLRITADGHKPSREGMESIRDMEEKFAKLKEKVVVDDFHHIDEILVKLYKHMDDVEHKELTGIATGFKFLDKITGGLQDGCTYIIASRPSVGKSAYMNSMILNAATNGHNVGVISLEMTDRQISARIASLTTEIDYWRIYRSRMIDEDQRNMFYAKTNQLSRLPIMISDATKVNIGDIKAKVSRLKSKGKIDILFIDYLQLLESEEDTKVSTSREREVSKISRGLKLLAKDFNIPIVILAQLNRLSEQGHDKKPKLHNLRESGSLEQDADGVMFIHRDWMSGIKQDENGRTTEDQADIIIAKWRDGEVTEYKIGFDGPKMKFYELEEQLNFKPVNADRFQNENPF